MMPDNVVLPEQGGKQTDRTLTLSGPLICMWSSGWPVGCPTVNPGPQAGYKMPVSKLMDPRLPIGCLSVNQGPQAAYRMPVSKPRTPGWLWEA